MHSSELLPYLQHQKQLAHYYRPGTAAFPTFISFEQVAPQRGACLGVRLHTDSRAVPLHRHDYFELMAVFSGAVTHCVNGIDYPLRPGDFFLLPPETDHAITQGTGDVLAVNLLFEASFFQRNPAPALFLNRTPPLRCSLEAGADAWHCLCLLLCEYFDPRPATPAVLAPLLAALLQLLAARLPVSKQTGGLYSLDVGAVLRYLDEHYAHVQLKEAASHFGYTPDHLSAALKAATGCSFMGLKQQRCMRAAALLLATTPANVQQIAAETGFANTTYFHRLFRQTFGCSPAEYRKAQCKPEDGCSPVSDQPSKNNG